MVVALVAVVVWWDEVVEEASVASVEGETSWEGRRVGQGIPSFEEAACLEEGSVVEVGRRMAVEVGIPEAVERRIAEVAVRANTDRQVRPEASGRRPREQGSPRIVAAVAFVG